MSFMYFLKLLHGAPRTLLHKWIGDHWQSSTLPYFQEVRRLCKKFLPTKHLFEIKWETHDMKQIQEDINKDQMIWKRQKMPKEHPFNCVQFKDVKHSSYMIISVDKLTTYDRSINKTAVKRYFELFYNFNSIKQTKPGHCNLCGNKIRSIDKHVVIHCKVLFGLKCRYWGRVRNELIEILNSPDGKYSLTFAIHVIKAINNMVNKPEQLWRLICGANCWKRPYRHSKKSDPKGFHFRNKWRKLLQLKYRFMWRLQAAIIRWVSLTKILYTNIGAKSKYLKLYSPVQRNLWHPSVFNSAASLIEWFEAIKADEDDIIVYTDGSHKRNKRGYRHAAGAGITIFYKGCIYMYSKALGWNEILYAEQFAIAQIFPLLEELSIDIRNKRIIICTDNEATFKSIYTNEEVPTYPKLLAYIKDHIFTKHPECKIIVCKVKSHIEEEPIYGNECADKCADIGRIASTIQWIETPKIPTCFKWSQVHYYNSCSDKIFLWDRIGIGIR